MKNILKNFIIIKFKFCMHTNEGGLLLSDLYCTCLPGHIFHAVPPHPRCFHKEENKLLLVVWSIEKDTFEC